MNYVDDELNWTNDDNKKFYLNMPKCFFDKNVEQSGLHMGDDVDLIMSYIKSAKSILDVGSGYGRVLKHLLNRNYRDKLYSIERNQKMCAYLRKHFSKRANIIEQDIKIFTPKIKFDVILLMWASFCEFSCKEQFPLLKRLVSMVDIDCGQIFVDSITLLCQPENSRKIGRQTQIIETPYGNDLCYIPSLKQMTLYAARIGLNMESFNYNLCSGTERIVYRLFK